MAQILGLREDMRDTLWQKLDHGGRKALPFFTAVVATFLGSIVWPLPYLGSVAPPLALMTVYFWALHRPDLFRPGMAFLIGILNDIVNFLPLGLSALLFVTAYQVVFQKRRFFVGHNFFVMWFGFLLTAFTVILLQWTLFSLVHWKIIPYFPVLMQIVFAVMLFPLPCSVLILLQRMTLATDGR